MSAPPSSDKIPVTVLTGYLGAGNPTLLNRILSEPHGKKYAVVVNEFGEIGIDNDLVVGADEEVFEMNNGCICCTVRGDLVRILDGLMRRKGKFDGIIVETTGSPTRRRWRRRSSSTRMWAARRASTSSSSAADTRSVLLIRITSAKAIWFLASGASCRRSLSHLASATVTTASSRVLRPDILVDEERLRHRRRIGEPRGLDNDFVELALAAHQAVENAHQVAAHGAADAAVVHLEHLLVGADDEVVVDADLAEFVDDDGVFLAVRLGEDAVEQGGLAGPQ